MARKCCVPGCSTKKSDKISYFGIPSNLIMKKAWSVRIGINMTEKDLVCAKHFQLKDIAGITPVKSVMPSKPKLKTVALPTIDVANPFPTTSRKKKSIEEAPQKKTPKSILRPMIKINESIQRLSTLPPPSTASNSNSSNVQQTTNEKTSNSKKSKKRKNKKDVSNVILDPLDIKTEIINSVDDNLLQGGLMSYSSFDYADSQNFFYSDTDYNTSGDMKVKDRLAHLEAENQQLKIKYSQLINDYVQMKTEKIQLKAELDAALAANQKLIIVKNSLVTTIQTIGKMSDTPVRVNGIPATIQLDPTGEMPDTIIGF